MSGRIDGEMIMKKRISIKTIIICLAALILLSGSIYVTAIEYGKMRTCPSGQEGLNVNEIFSDASKEQIVAEINGIPVSAFEVGLKRYLNDDLLDDMAILNEIAKERFLLENAKATGINISYDDIMKEIREEEEYVESEAARGNELMIQRQKEDEKLLTALGMTKDEFNKEIYADILLYNKIFIEYGKYYYTSNPNYIMTFEEYIDQEFDKADIKIVRYHDSKNHDSKNEDNKI